MGSSASRVTIHILRRCSGASVRCANELGRYETRLKLSATVIPPTRLLHKFLQQLALSLDVLPYITTHQAMLTQFLALHGDSQPFSHFTIASIYQFLLDANAPTMFGSSDISTSHSSELSPPARHMILSSLKSRARNVFKCACCGLPGHIANNCGFRGTNFQPRELQRIVAQYNTMHGDSPSTSPPDKWHSLPPPASLHSSSSSLTNYSKSSSGHLLKPSINTKEVTYIPPIDSTEVTVGSITPNINTVIDTTEAVSDSELVPVIQDIEDPYGARLFTT